MLQTSIDYNYHEVQPAMERTNRDLYMAALILTLFAEAKSVMLPSKAPSA